MRKLAILFLLAGCATTESAIHAAALKADAALTYAETHPDAMQAAWDALDAVDGHSATIAQGVNDAKGLLDNNPAAAHAALAKIIATTVSK